MIEDKVWVQKYRPKTIEECILPDNIKKKFLKFREKGEVPNLMLIGKPGVGKTTIVKALMSDIQADMKFVNASKDGNIDVLRNEIQDFASRFSLESSHKYVVLDEGDEMSQKTQKALRGFIEEFSKNCGFILTCNFPNKLIEPLRKRFIQVEFNIPNKGDEYKKLLKLSVVKCFHILKDNNVEYDEKAIVQHVKHYFPDLRSAINELQYLASAGKISEEAVNDALVSDIDTLFNILQDKKFTDMVKWVDENNGLDFSYLVENLYKKIDKEMIKENMPSAILLINEYDYKSTFVTNPSLNTKAMLLRIMSECF